MDELALANQIRAWQSGVEAERAFWDRWFATGGDNWPTDFKERLRADREIEPWILGSAPFHEMKILDVGAGPLTILGCCYKGDRLDITATDPLALIYSELTEKHGISPPVQTELAFAEDLTSFYEEDTFDLVHCRNALDHSFDPVRGVSEMLRVTKVGGRVLLRHFTNEAEHEKYEGFHQWNFEEINTRFIIWNRSSRIDVADVFEDIATVETMVSGRDIITTITKTGGMAEVQTVELKKRLKMLLSSLIYANQMPR